ncbi:MAG: hypothetical protein JWR05_2284 [Mucilaginibacter sp.]|nr:hypothetical protein [Mucilaginibacter sp.]
MQDNKYRITLYNSRWNEEMITFDLPVLPNVGDILQLAEETDLFLVKERALNIYNDNGFQNVVLFGEMEKDHFQTQRSWDRFLETLKNEHSKRIKD